jgi:riboflavin kinase/FMN adenylyltransferase
MQILKSLAELPETIGPCAVTLGNFDGVHLGHRERSRSFRFSLSVTASFSGLFYFVSPVEREIFLGGTGSNYIL